MKAAAYELFKEQGTPQSVSPARFTVLEVSLPPSYHDHWFSCATNVARPALVTDGSPGQSERRRPSAL